MDPGYLKAFFITGIVTCVGVIARYGPRKFFAADNHYIQALVTFLIFGGLLGMLAYFLLLRFGVDFHWWF